MYITYQHHLHILVEQALELAEKYEAGLYISKVINGSWYELHSHHYPIDNNPIIHIPYFSLFSKTLLPREKRIINKAMRLIDQSNLWPICGRYNVTEYAIRFARKYEQKGGEFDCAYSYWKFLEQTITTMVNN